jgi:hypothetical protein
MPASSGRGDEQKGQSMASPDLRRAASHRLLLENDRVRVLEVAIEPRTRQPGHTHQEVSVMIIDEPARIGYYAGDALRFESQARSGSPPGVRVRGIEPEGRIPSRTSTSTATTRSALNSGNAGAAGTRPCACSADAVR